MGKLFLGKLRMDEQVEEFNMSTLPEGRLTLPVGAIKNVSEISDAVKVGVANTPVAGGDKLVQST